VASLCRIEARFGGWIGNEGHRRLVWVAMRPAARTNCQGVFVFSFPLLISFHRPMVWIFLPNCQITGLLTTYPPPRRKEPSGTTCSEKGVFFFLFLNLSFIKDGSGSIGAASDGGALPARDVNSGWLDFCLCVVYLGVVHVIRWSEEDDYGSWASGKQRQEGWPTNNLSGPRTPRSNGLFSCRPSEANQPASPAFVLVSVSPHKHPLLLCVWFGKL
jgi:hypothetical protein